MKIRLDTSRARGIRNQQDHDISGYDLHICKKLEADYPLATRRSKPTAIFNCHGLTFGCRRTKITDRESVNQILCDDHWKEVPEKDAEPGDIVVYFDDSGDPSHSGLVVAKDDMLGIPTIVSKWGVGPEFIHTAAYVPPIYGTLRRYYHCSL